LKYILIYSFFTQILFCNINTEIFTTEYEKYNDIFLLVLFSVSLLLGYILYRQNRIINYFKKIVKLDKSLLNAMDSPIFWQDKNSIVLDANSKFCELIDLKYETILGKNLTYFSKENIYIDNILEALESLQNDSLNNSQITLKDKHNNLKIFLINQTSYKEGIVTIFTDITKQNELELEQVKNREYMIQKSKLADIGEIFSSISHQWKEPLVEITSLAQDMFFSETKNKKEEDSYHIKNIMIQAKYMTETINEFQDFILPSKSKIFFKLESTIKSMLRIVNHNMKYNYININIEIAKKLNSYTYGYENEFMQAMLNILNNSKDALLSNKEDNRNICIKLKNEDEFIVIDILDNGFGINKEDTDKIFLQYFSTKDNGHGIGLYMTKLIIEDKLNGNIECKYMLKGSCFRIKLRVYDENISS
jgi:signal transduction histidine kinase